MLFTVLFSISVGSIKIPVKDVVLAMIGRQSDSTFHSIIINVRIPRTFAAVLAGSALTVSGCILQAVLNNTLAAPNIIGINAGAGLFVVLLCALFPVYQQYTAIAAFTGAMIAVTLVYYAAKHTGASRTAIILSGVAISSLCGALSDTFLTLYPDTAIARVDFSIGSFAGETLSNLKLPGILIGIGLVLALFFAYELNLLSLGDEAAMSLGLPSGVFRGLFFAIAALLAGSAISFSGLIGFVGLIVPHMVRMFTGNDYRYVIPIGILNGASFALICDIMARTLFAPFEIPVGIIMSFIGAPFFLYLLFMKKRRLSA